MIVRIMHVIEDLESKETTQLKLLLNTNNRIYLEMGPETDPEFPYSQCMVINDTDARALADELYRLADEIGEFESSLRTADVSVIPDVKNGTKELTAKKKTAEIHARMDRL